MVREKYYSLPGMPAHLQSTVTSQGVTEDRRPLRGGEGTRRTGFLQGRRIGLASAVLNLVNAIIGSGVLGVPYIMSKTGLALTLMLLVMSAVMIDYTLQLLIASAVITAQPGSRFSYELLGEQAFGIRGRLLVSIMIMTQNTGNMVSYFKVFSDVISDIMNLVTDNSLLKNSKFMTTMAALLFVFPISCSSKIGLLAYVGIFQIIIILVFVGYVFVEALVTGSDQREGNIEMFAPTTATFLAMPTFCFSFICHTALLPIFDELQEADDLGRTKRPRKRISLVVHCSIAIACTFYAIASVSGYLIFGSNTDNDLLVNFKISHFEPLSDVMRISFALGVLLSVPLQCFPFRRALTSVLDISRGKYTPITWLAKDIFALDNYKTLTAEERAEALGIDISTRESGIQCSDESLEFVRYVFDNPNLYSYDLPEDVSAKEVAEVLGHYKRWIKYGELMLTAAPQEPIVVDEEMEPEGNCPAPSEGWVSHIAKTAFAVGWTLLLALFVPAITVVFGVAGATSSVWLELILPAAIYMKLSLRKANLSDVNKYGSIRELRDNGTESALDVDKFDELRTQELRESVDPLAHRLPVMQLCIGFFVFFVSWGGMIYNWIAGSGDSSSSSGGVTPFA
eukprot:TRINITY_DN5245_c1_g1_i1.p1 TRINITY_DN5245_c1_g1~~TRINITY_DN5245_c1_g1_i1.p1  ORF type:complete len:641 (+),score=132.76 TRINITY_DN5245_c1_g1_i1:54-1925(+)